MKKSIFTLMSIVALFAASCTTDATSDVQMVGGEEAVVTFSVQTTGLGSRAVDINDGKKATELTYAIYDEAWNHLQTYEAEFENGSLVKEFSLRLVKNKTYNFVFWAQNPNVTCYTMDFETAGQKPSVSVNYDALVANNDNYDAFFGQELALTVNGTVNKTVYLKRPFAQINFGTDDLQAAKDLGFDLAQAKVSVTTMTYSKFFLNDGAVDGATREVTFTEADAIDKTAADKNLSTESHGDYHWVSMNYILWPNPDVAADASKDLSLSKCEMTIAVTGQTPIKVEVPQAPARRNWRTNLVGSLLTEQGNIKVEILPEFEGEYNTSLPLNYIAETNTLEVRGSEAFLEIIKWSNDSAARTKALKDILGDDSDANLETFEGMTIELYSDVDLNVGMNNGERISVEPICNKGVFKGTLDGNGYTIKNLYQSGWAFGYKWGLYGSLGLFYAVDNATVKDVTIEGFECFVEGGDISFIAGSATGTCVFEDITIKDATIATYNNGCGGIIGWSGAGNYTFKNITIGEDVVLGGLWGSFDSSIGGVVGQAESGATYNFENVEISCRLDVYNDCTASYDYYLYRMCGMIIGRCDQTTTIDGSNYPDLSKYNITFNNVVVNYGDWMNYHYCEPTPGHNNGRGMRVEPGYAYDGLPADFDHSQCVDNHYACIPFDQLIGGDQLGVKGLPAVDGVKVNYPYTYNQSELSTSADVINAINNGQNVKLAADVNVGTTQLALDNVKIDLNGHTLTTQMTYGGISLKNGASIKNGTIEHTATVAAIKAFNVGEIENVTIKNSCATANKTVTGIAIQQGGHVGSIKNVQFEGVSQAIEVGYQATVDLIEGVEVYGKANGTAEGIGLVINGGKVGKAVNSTFKGDNYGVKMLLKGVFAVGLELEGCSVEGTTASIAAYDEKGISNTSGSLVLTYDAATTLTGPFVWDFEDECLGVVTLNRP